MRVALMGFVDSKNQCKKREIHSWWRNDFVDQEETLIVEDSDSMILSWDLSILQ